MTDRDKSRQAATAILIVDTFIILLNTEREREMAVIKAEFNNDGRDSGRVDVIKRLAVASNHYTHA